MSINGINGGYVPGTTLSPDLSQVALKGQVGGKELDSLMQAQLNDKLKGLMNGSNPAGSLPPPEDLDKAGASAATKGLGTLQGDQVNADIYAFMALFAKIAQSMRDTARTQRTTEMQAQVTALQNAAEKMKDAAALRFAGAVVQGAMQIAGGMVQIDMSSASMSNTIKGAQVDAGGKNMVAQSDLGRGSLPKDIRLDLKTAGNDQIAQGAAFSAKGAAQQGYGQAAGSIAGGAGTAIGAGLNYAADLKEADKAKLETEAKVHETAVQHANDMMQQMMDVIRDVRDKLQSIQQASIETNRGIARNI